MFLTNSGSVQYSYRVVIERDQWPCKSNKRQKKSFESVARLQGDQRDMYLHSSQQWKPRIGETNARLKNEEDGDSRAEAEKATGTCFTGDG